MIYFRFVWKSDRVKNTRKSFNRYEIPQIICKKAKESVKKSIVIVAENPFKFSADLSS